MTREYDPQADAIGSYYAAVEAKRLRGDTHWPGRDEPLRVRACFDWEAFGLALRAQLTECNPGLKRLAEQLGVTASDISRASSGVPVRIEKVMALADWMGRPEREFFNPASTESKRCSSPHMKHGGPE